MVTENHGENITWDIMFKFHAKEVKFEFSLEGVSYWKVFYDKIMNANYLKMYIKNEIRGELIFLKSNRYVYNK